MVKQINNLEICEVSSIYMYIVPNCCDNNLETVTGAQCFLIVCTSNYMVCRAITD